jgi:hypothetical protein
VKVREIRRFDEAPPPTLGPNIAAQLRRKHAKPNDGNAGRNTTEKTPEHEIRIGRRTAIVDARRHIET